MTPNDRNKNLRLHQRSWIRWCPALGFWVVL